MYGEDQSHVPQSNMPPGIPSNRLLSANAHCSKLPGIAKFCPLASSRFMTCTFSPIPALTFIAGFTFAFACVRPAPTLRLAKSAPPPPPPSGVKCTIDGGADKFWAAARRPPASINATSARVSVLF